MKKNIISIVLLVVVLIIGGYFIYSNNFKKEIPNDVLKLFNDVSPLNKGLSGYPTFFDKSLSEQGVTTMINITTYLNRDNKESLSKDKIDNLKGEDLGLLYCGASLDVCVNGKFFLDKDLIVEKTSELFNVDNTSINNTFNDGDIGFCGGFSYDKDNDVIYQFDRCGGGPYAYYEKIYKYDINKDDSIDIYVYASYTEYIDGEFYIKNKLEDKKYKYSESFLIDESNEKDMYRIKYSFKKNSNDIYYVENIVNIDK